MRGSVELIGDRRIVDGLEPLPAAEPPNVGEPCVHQPQHAFDARLAAADDRDGSRLVGTHARDPLGQPVGDERAVRREPRQPGRDDGSRADADDQVLGAGDRPAPGLKDKTFVPK